MIQKSQVDIGFYTYWVFTLLTTSASFTRHGPSFEYISSTLIRLSHLLYRILHSTQIRLLIHESYDIKTHFCYHINITKLDLYIINMCLHTWIQEHYKNLTSYSKLLIISSANGSASSRYRMKSFSEQSTAILEAKGAKVA